MFTKVIKNISKNEFHGTILLVYIWFIGLFSAGLFLYGFFPIINHNIQYATENDIPKLINDVEINSEHLYKPTVQKVIFMVIDALRWDFVHDAYKLDVMPFTRDLIANKSATLLQVKVTTPTVTLPRLKTMISGSVSNFVDVVLNFGKIEISTDNVLFQAKHLGHEIVFYGDDTWIKLFPDVFKRSEGTTSFFVTDFIEVDSNVTRHIDEELYVQNDWSMMILHYLGLDHIGHIHGPQSSLIKPKLNEMDEIIKKIVTRMQYWKSDGVETLFIVCGDHGMKNSGGHGGASTEETLVPLIAFGIDTISQMNDEFIQIDQVDIPATLSVMLGIPIPSSNIGSVAIDLINKLPTSKKLFMLYYNAKCTFTHFQNLSDYQEHSAYRNYMNAVRMHTEWMKEKDFSRDASAIIHQYQLALKEMKNLLLHRIIYYNLNIMSVAIVLMCHVVIMVLNCDTYYLFSPKKFIYCWILSIGLWMLLNYIFQDELNDSSIMTINSRLALTIFIIFTVNCYWYAKMSWETFFNVDGNYSDKKYLIAVFTHTFSLASTSFIEEEHQTWYFFWSTFLLISIFTHTQKKFHLGVVKNIAKIILLFILHRILRKLNSSGDKYAHLPVISDWLKESKTEMSLVLIIALVSLIIIGFVSADSKHRKISLIFHLIMSNFIYLRHAGNGSVIQPLFYSQSSTKYGVQLFFIAILGFVVLNALNINKLFKSNNCQRSYRKVLYNIIQLWVMMSALLHRSHNVILLPIQLITCRVMWDLLELNKNKMTDIYISYCLGNVFYFYQGNSNSLATVDVAAGYVGLQTYMPVIVVFFISINTYSAPVLSYFMFLYGIMSKQIDCNINKKISLVNRQVTFLKFSSLTVYTIIIIIMRYHLFIWSVFSPKLFYETIYTTVLFILMFIMQILFLLLENKNHE